MTSIVPDTIGMALPKFNVAIWNHEGDVVRAYWGVTADKVDSIQDEYADDHMHTVVVEER